MSPRSLRRAAERQALQLQRREQPQLSPEIAPAHPASPARPAPPRNALPQNALPQTAPFTLQPLLTGRTLLLPASDAPEYARHLLEYQSALRPMGLRELALVQSLADTQWRLHRLVSLETALYTHGRLTQQSQIACPNAPASHDPALTPAMMDLQTHLKYEKQIRHIQLQENRFQRRCLKEMCELRQLQHERQNPAPEPESVQPRASAAPPSAPPAPAGFEFSSATLSAHPPLATAAVPLGFEFSNRPQSPALAPDGSQDQSRVL